MRFAIATVDRYLGVFEAFVLAGWKPVKLFTIPVRSPLGNQQAVIAYAEKHGAAIQLSRINERDMQELREQGCEVFIVASYDWKVGDWQPFLKYAVNFHCSPLPEGRGAYPIIRAIMENRNSWAVTCHRLSPELDRGDIIAVETFPLLPDECHERLDLKTQMAAKRLAGRVVDQFLDLWEQAKPQIGGSYWQNYKIEERVIDFKKPVESIMRHIRAFGAIESLANINNTWLFVKRAMGWAETHNQVPGKVVHVYEKYIVVAATDGYIALLEWNFAPSNIITLLKKKENIESASP